MFCLPNLSTGDIATLQRGTPLYGQPSWWGDGDADDENSVKHDAKASEQKQARCEAGKIHCCRVKGVVHFSKTFADNFLTPMSSKISMSFLSSAEKK